MCTKDPLVIEIVPRGCLDGEAKAKVKERTHLGN